MKVEPYKPEDGYEYTAIKVTLWVPNDVTEAQMRDALRTSAELYGLIEAAVEGYRLSDVDPLRATIAEV